MITYSTRQAAKLLGITQAALSKYLRAKKVPAPAMVTSGRMTLHLWTKADISRTKMLLPKIANGRKTRYQKLGDQQETQPRAAALRKSRRTKKKK
jgi:hypothetical protein